MYDYTFPEHTAGDSLTSLPKDHFDSTSMSFSRKWQHFDGDGQEETGSSPADLISTAVDSVSPKKRV